MRNPGTAKPRGEATHPTHPLPRKDRPVPECRPEGARRKARRSQLRGGGAQKRLASPTDSSGVSGPPDDRQRLTRSRACADLGRPSSRGTRPQLTSGRGRAGARALPPAPSPSAARDARRAEPIEARSGEPSRGARRPEPSATRRGGGGRWSSRPAPRAGRGARGSEPRTRGAEGSPPRTRGGEPRPPAGVTKSQSHPHEVAKRGARRARPPEGARGARRGAPGAIL